MMLTRIVTRRRCAPGVLVPSGLAQTTRARALSWRHGVARGADAVSYHIPFRILHGRKRERCPHDSLAGGQGCVCPEGSR